MCFDGAIVVTDELVIMSPTREDVAQSMVVTDAPRTGFGLVEDLSYPIEFLEHDERGTQIETEVNSPLDRLSVFRKSAKSRSRLLQERDCLAVCRPASRFRGGLVKVRHRLGPSLTPNRVVSEALHLFDDPTGIGRLDGISDARVKTAAAVVEKTAIHHLVRERVFERVLEFWKESGLVEELRGLEAREAEPQRVLSLVYHSVQEVVRD